jgi:hypothetical protein
VPDGRDGRRQVRRRRPHGRNGGARLRAALLLSFTLLGIAACAGAGQPRRAPTHRAIASADAGPDTSVDAAIPSELPAFEALEARGPNDPAMLIHARATDATRPTVVAAGATDACFRAVVAASSPIHAAWFEDEGHVLRGARTMESVEQIALVPPRGPACARKGESLRLVIEPATAGVARAIVWRSR